MVDDVLVDNKVQPSPVLRLSNSIVDGLELLLMTHEGSPIVEPLLM
jgi:hypothetical protein